jgi:hypothetical protein
LLGIAGRVPRSIKEQPEPVAVIGGIRGAQATRRQGIEQIAGDRRVTALTRGYLEREGTAATIDNNRIFVVSSVTPNR